MTMCACGALAAAFAADPAVAQSAKRATFGIAAAMSDMASRQISADNEVEVARRKSEIELELQRRLRELDKPAGGARPAADDPEAIELARRHPQWVRLLTSTAFHQWLRAQAPDTEAACRSSASAVVVSACLDAFLGPVVVR